MMSVTIFPCFFPLSCYTYIMTIEQTIEIPASRLITIEVPPEIPTGKVILTFTSAAEPKVAADDGLDFEGECPLCAKSHTPNAETAAAIREGRAMMRGEIPSKLYNSLEEMLVDLDSDD
jgi:hypothetical protein